MILNPIKSQRGVALGETALGCLHSLCGHRRTARGTRSGFATINGHLALAHPAGSHGTGVSAASGHLYGTCPEQGNSYASHERSLAADGCICRVRALFHHPGLDRFYGRFCEIAPIR